MRGEGEIVIGRPLEEVFDFAADQTNEPRYNPRMIRAEKVTSGPVGVGTRFRSTMTGRGRAAEMTGEITEFERPRRVASTWCVPGMDIGYVLLFDSVSQGTRMRWIWELEPRGLYRLLGPLLHRMGERQELEIWTGLKHYLEARTAGDAFGPGSEAP